MMQMSLSEAAGRLGARQLGDDAVFARVGTDTRTLPEGALFVALKGPRFDGHDYLAAAQARGAVGAMVERRLGSGLPLLLVADTRLGIAELARTWRQQAAPRLLAITGSNGKTTVKEMAAAILGRCDQTLATRGNLNNDIGLPLTLLRLQGEGFAVVELGANHPGEIASLSRMACPDVALLNNAGAAHLEGFGSIEGVARAKAEILDGLREDGVFVYNANDPFAPLWRTLVGDRRTCSFGLGEAADVRSPEADIEIHWRDGGFFNRFPVQTPEGPLEVELHLGGRHNRMNALAALAACQVMGADAQAICQGLAGLQPVRGRLQPRPGMNGLHLIDDSYNANPDSVAAAIQVLASAPGRRFLVLGDLAELGREGMEQHARLGDMAREAGLDHLYCVGPMSRAAAERFGSGGYWLQDQMRLIDAVMSEAGAGDFLLIKGSRASAMDRVADALASGEEH
jgi:UDP-N-acetylmuramoyl-tripeptide--D-alanyl-D-alanine ligase